MADLRAGVNRDIVLGEQFIVLWGVGLTDSLSLLTQVATATMVARLLWQSTAWKREPHREDSTAQPTSEERLLADFCDHSAIGMCSIAPNGRILWANQSELQMLGYAPQEYIGHHVTEFHVDVAAMTEVLARLRSGNSLREYEARLRCRNGSTKYVLIDSNVHHREGELVTTRFFTRDITERRQSEARQRELYSRYESLVTHSPAGIFETDVKGRCVFVNDKWCELSGLNRQQSLGLGWKQAFHPDDRERELQAWQSQTQVGEELQLNCRFMTPQGTVTWIHGSVVPLRMNNEHITGFLGTITDITAMKQAESVIREARNQAENANRTKSEFLANMSHEMRTPLNGIIGMTELALDAANDPDQRDCLQTVKESADSLLTIINELLDFAKVESGKIILDKVDFNLAEWLRDSLKPLVFRSRQKGLDFNCVIDSAIPQQLVGDPEWLRHILVNLVSNAVKFTDQGFVKVAVELQTSPHSESQWELDTQCLFQLNGAGLGARVTLHFSVQDTGIGIAPDKYKAVFVPFEQADKSITRRYGGTGLGLAIARQLTELMNGEIWIESELGKGTTFHFTVQLNTPQQGVPLANPLDQDLRLPAARNGESSRTLNVLVVEDNSVNQKLIVKLLKKQGHQTAVANDGEEAVQMLTGSHPYDVVLMDMQMPKLGGLEATMQVRLSEMKSGQHIPIFALTASALKGDRERCLAAGMDGYLTKPVNRNELSAALAQVAGHAPNLQVDPEHIDPKPADSEPVDSKQIDLDIPTSNSPSAELSSLLRAEALQKLKDEDTCIIRTTPANAQPPAAMPVDTEEVINRQTLWKRLDGDRDLLKELYDGYRETCPGIVQELREGVTSQDPQRIQRAAHQIKGMVGSFSATRAFRTARDLESSGQSANLHNAPEIFGKLERALQEVDQELASIVNQG